MARKAELDELIELRLRADENEALVNLYQKALLLVRPTPDDFDYIDAQVTARRAQRQSGGSSAPAASGYLPAADVIDAFRGSTPMSRLYAFINRIGQRWDDDARDPLKAYVMACFSEIAYLHLTDYELAERDRYKLFEPSLAHGELRRRSIVLNVAQVSASVADIPLEIILTRRFVYLIGRTNKFTVIAVRGTSSWRDLGIDLDALKNPARNGFYHRGFADEAEAALPLLLEAVGDGQRLYITGHSLGAAVAAILAQTWPPGPSVAVPYLLASPRFGTRAAARRLPRYTYARALDPVVHLPPRLLGFSDEGAIATVLPASDTRRGGWASIWHTASRRTAEHHSVEGLRRLAGDAVGESFPERVYIDALIDAMKAT